jgi:hypothetical protein
MPLCLALLVLSACRGQDAMTPSVTTPSSPLTYKSDGNNHGGNPDFFLLPPLARDPSGSPNYNPGASNVSLTPSVDICALDVSGTTQAQMQASINASTACKGALAFSATLGAVNVSRGILDDNDIDLLHFIATHYPSLTEPYYHIGWKVPMTASLGSSTPPTFYRVKVRVGSKLLGFADVESINNFAQLFNVTTGEFVPLTGGLWLPINFRIERYALCAIPGVGPCTSQTVDLNTGGTVQTVIDPATGSLPSGITIAAGSLKSGTSSTTTITVESCPDMNDRAIDLPTFGGCVRVTANPALPDGGLAVAATVFNCNVSDVSVLPVVADHDQADRITLHKLDEIPSGDGVRQVITALPHAPACGPQTAAGGSWRGMFAALRQGRVRSVVRELGAMLAPKPAYAAMMIDLGGGGFTVDCCSDFQFALPAKAEVVPSTDKQVAPWGSLLPVLPTVKVTDLDGKAVSGARVRFSATNGSVSAASAVTGVDGLAQTAWTIGNASQNALVASGRGIAGTDFSGPRDGVDPFQPIQSHFDPLFTGVAQQVSVRTGSVTFTATGQRGIAIYKNYNAWYGENRDETVLQAPPFNFVAGRDYVVRGMSALSGGIPADTKLIIITSASQGDYLNQVTDERAGFGNLDAWVRSGGLLVIHAGYNFVGYHVPGLLGTGTVDNVLNCAGLTLAVTDHALIRGPDATLGTADDLTNTNIDMAPGPCYDNHGSLAGLLPDNSQVLITEQLGDHRPVYATYPLGSGRVIVTTLTLEYAYHPTQTLVNHFYWAINGPNPPAAVFARLSAPAAVRSLLPSGPVTVNTDGSPRQ